ncbi:hypothetical protein TMEN_5866 [Trichophyton mentagrophytes]|uniref:Uncharacterized protein n=1 Tax=Trichophyton interdigitale (strain MR816) TaxID=1215338 RepID=A0A059IYQ6_TRIIM|nr:hypothetical protein H101_01063 [Trichophyton interdigitale H6]KDB20588.1 hypothetical protein H109_07461 [Trichophyton interdigitale MR816]GBF63244.1 hypothetical protein TMEN_5866 [Trichophyton mentagrophytes]
MPGAINWEPPASQASSNIMGMMMLKKRKRDAESRQENTVVPSPSIQTPSCLQTRVGPSSIGPVCSRTDLISPPSKPRTRPLISPLKKRRLEQKTMQSKPLQPVVLYPRTAQTNGSPQHAQNNSQYFPTNATSDDYIMKNAGDSPRDVHEYYISEGEQDGPIPELRQQAGSSPNKASTGDKQTLAPCHICHRRPTTRTALDAYADCEICSRRACFVCLRECDDVYCRERDNHIDSESCRKNIEQEEYPGRRICSCCAVEGILETGEEVVRCLICVEHG